MVNMEYACDHCQGVIIGRRMNCNVCDDFDLCYGCYSAKKYSDSHLPTHSITVYPMVTIRISDRQRLIQPYVHNYSWLLFAALTLYSADLANGEEVEGEKLDSQVLSHARVLQHQCIQLIGDCLMKAQHGKADDCPLEDSAQKQAEKVLTPSQEQVFAECSQKRILGLLAAMLPPFKSVLCMGTRSVYMDNANEPHNVIILKHFTEKNRAVVVDIKTRKRKTVKDYQLIQKCGPEGSDSQTQLRQYLQHFVLISTHLLQTSMDSSYAEAVEATWVLSLALKGLYRTLKIHGFKEIQAAFLQSGLLKLLVKKCSKGTGFSKTWLLRDLEILSIMLYSSKKEISSLAEREDTELEEREQDQDVEQPVVGPVDLEQNKLDPLEGLDEATKICFLVLKFNFTSFEVTVNLLVA
ncbi:zinc finger zz-type and ef-hand domain-containing protein 1 [Limosa lapponica baueri]|uniref:Zinc finger zz-type and ef-hand domain-containing protein 1 n=1 Tax=Limosa lapponica baueri TaxID=1758121 RepID=A0A2I0TEY7_LIMLA|nr:zinc finger zz-type and ef-hand domain-containing protein 1 [Limosa lapponica baueri]